MEMNEGTTDYRYADNEQRRERNYAELLLLLESSTDRKAFVEHANSLLNHYQAATPLESLPAPVGAQT